MIHRAGECHQTCEWSQCHRHFINTFSPDNTPKKSELNSITHRISQRVAGFLERRGLFVRDDKNDNLALDGLEDDPMLQIHGYSITYRIATGKQQGQKVFTL